MATILKKGRFLQTDAEGFLVNEARLENIVPPWKEGVEETKQAYLHHLPGRIHSVYLRGSIPRGEAVQGISDLDTLAVTLPGPEPLDLSWIGPFKSTFLKKYPFVSDVEFQFFPLDSLLNAPSDLTRRFIVKTLSVCLYGEDLSAKIRPFKPDLSVAYAFHGGIQQDVAMALIGFRQVKNPAQIRQGCTWIMKRLLRAGFSLFMTEEKTYTRDLYLCHEVFARHHPERKAEIRQALEWAVNPTEDVAVLSRFLEDFGKWVGRTAQARFFPAQD